MLLAIIAISGQRSLIADAFSVFKKEGIFNQATAQRFRDNILSRGGTEHPMTLSNVSVDKSQLLMR